MLRSHSRILAAWALLAAATLALAALGCHRRAAPPREELRIGMLAPISGPVRFTGHLLLRARVAELNAAGGLALNGRRVLVRLFVEDSGHSVEQAMSAMGRLVEQNRVAAVIGPDYSREAIPVGAALEALGVPMLTPSATNPEVTRGRRYAFRVCQMDTTQAAVLARYAMEDMGARRVAVLYDEADAYSRGLAEAFRRSLAARPGMAVRMEPYDSGTEDFSGRLARIEGFGAQALFLPNFPADLTRQLQQARAAGFSGRLLGGDSWDTDAGFHALPEAQGAVYSTDFFPGAVEPRLLADVQALARRSGAELNKDTALCHDALELILAAAQRAGATDPASLRAGLAGMTGFEGLTGSISFAHGGDPDREAFLVRIEGGRPALRARMPLPEGR